MSRIGKKLIRMPENVSVVMDHRTIHVKGPKGDLNWEHPDRMKVSVNDGQVSVERAGDTKAERALHGLTRSIIANMVTGVSQGYQKVLDIVGVGYKAQASGNVITFTLGYSHPIVFELPDGIKATTDQKQIQITLTGVDKQQIGQIAASLKSLRLPDAYKGKGVRYSGERLKLKVGKAGKK